MTLPYATSDRNVDLVAIDRLLTGGRPRPVLAEHELQHAARILTDHGLSADQIGKRIGVSARTVSRWRAAREETT